MHRVVIVGAGFAGLSTARALARTGVDVTVVDRRNFSTFQPLLYEVATAGLDPGDVAYPIRTLFGRDGNVSYRYATVDGVDWDRHLVRLEGAAPLPFDSIVVASGSTARFFGIPGAEEHSFPLYTLDDARTLRDHILRRLEEADADPSVAAGGTLTFVVVGGGPTGVEVAGALVELLDVAVVHDGFRFGRQTARILLVDGADRLLTPFRPVAASYAARTLRGRGVELVLGTMVRSIGPSSVELDDGTVVATRTVVWAGGITAEGTVAPTLGTELGPTGRMVVGRDLAVPGHPGAYAVGDAAAIPRGASGDQLCPQLAPVAIQSGAHAARQILRRLEGRPSEPFHYRDKGIMATIGRRAAVTQLPGGLLIRGTIGWLAWLGLHILYLVGLRNKVVVLINWAWRYLSWGSGPRVIIGDELDRVGGGGAPGGAG